MSAPVQAPAPRPAEEEEEEKRQVLVATYYAPRSIFAIPIGLDLKDETIVKGWGVKWNKLIIEFVDGTDLKISPTFDASDNDDLKYPQDTEIQDNGEYDCELDEDEFKTVAVLQTIQTLR